MSELKPCPVCGSEAYITRLVGCFRVICKNENCQIIGPKSESRGVAFFEWNALPRPLRWTKEPPTEPGYYWLRQTSTKGLVQIIRACGEELQYNWEDAEWAGPIQEPVE